jgi:hypothetical protein
MQSVGPTLGECTRYTSKQRQVRTMPTVEAGLEIGSEYILSRGPGNG